MKATYMRILILTPLYPPDTGRLAVYLKQLAARLAEHSSLRILTYGEFPEALPHVHVSCVSKRLPLVIRIVAFTLRVWREVGEADVLYLADGASVGFPSILVARLRGIPVLRHVMEDEFWERSTQLSMPKPDVKLKLIRWLQGWVLRYSTQVIVPTSAHQKTFAESYQLASSRMLVVSFPPERIPRSPFSLQTEEEYIRQERLGWDPHVSMLRDSFEKLCKK